MEPVADQQVQDPGGDHDPPAETRETPDGKGQTGAREQKKLKRPLKPLSQSKVKDYNEGLAKRGVVYLSRVPPFMKPAKVKHLMEQHGVVTRVSEPQRRWECEALSTWSRLMFHVPLLQQRPVCNVNEVALCGWQEWAHCCCRCHSLRSETSCVFSTSTNSNANPFVATQVGFITQTPPKGAAAAASCVSPRAPGFHVRSHDTRISIVTWS